MIIFLYGADTFRSRRFLHELKDKFTRDVDPDASSVDAIDGAAATLKEISGKINTGSLFVKKRLVVIENLFKNKKGKIFNELSDYLKDFAGNEDNILIFRDEELDTKDRPVKADEKKLFGWLKQQPFSQEFKPLSGGQLAGFIRKEAAARQKGISAEAVTLLADLAGGDLWLISGNINKLAHALSGKEISAEDVKRMVAGSYDENIFGLTDALSARNKTAAADLLEEQYAAGASDEYLVTMLIRQVKILLQIREALDKKINPGEIAARLKIHPFVAKKGMMQARNFSSDWLKNCLNRLIRTDFLNKTGQGDIKTELTLLIADL